MYYIYCGIYFNVLMAGRHERRANELGSTLRKLISPFSPLTRVEYGTKLVGQIVYYGALELEAASESSVVFCASTSTTPLSFFARS